MPASFTPRTRLTTRGVRVVAFAAVLQLTGGLSVAALQFESAPLSAVSSRARTVPPAVAVDGSVSLAQTPPADPALAAATVRTSAVGELLGRRSAALLRRDRVGFLATVDPRAGALRTRQAQLFEALAQVPLGSWSYALSPQSQRISKQLDTRYGSDNWWAPGVALSYALAGFDARPTVAEQYLTFVRRDGRWLLSADDDFAADAEVTPKQLWERGPVLAVRAPGTLVLGRPQAARLLREIAQATAEAIPRVSRVWGPMWQRTVVVVVPTDTTEMAELLDSDGDLSRIAAVATAELDGEGSYDPAGDRVVVNPATFSGLSQLGRQVVLTHEVTHVATRRATGPAVPAWLAEGLADYVAYVGLDVPLSVAARELRRDVRAGRVPTQLPADSDFDGANPQLAQAYEQAWLAVVLLAEQHGQDALLRLYRAVGAVRGISAGSALDASLRQYLDTDAAALLVDWRAALRRQLA